MFLISFTEPRVIGIVVGLSIAVVSLTAIVIRYFVHRHRVKSE